MAHKRQLIFRQVIYLFLACWGSFWINAVEAVEYPKFSLHKLGTSGPTLLIVGGIQGDEPGGFNAASLLVTRYQINKGSLWVVPNLNFPSIIKRSRGIYGDLNRKFAAIGKNDPEFDVITAVKSMILDKQVDMILNLHDGSGFYRNKYYDRRHNPLCWGQSVIIDQDAIKSPANGHLHDIARKISYQANRSLLSEEHAYHVNNTKTRMGNIEMSKSLTYFAIKYLKPAFGVEASKSFPTHVRAYYHLKVIEAFMDYLGIEYEKAFSLTASNVKHEISTNINLALYNKKIFLDVANARNRLGYIPLKKDSVIDYIPSNPLITIIESDQGYKVFHGNRRLTQIIPQYFEFDTNTNHIEMQVDGDAKKVCFGETVGVENNFSVLPQKNYRVNVIGFYKPGIENEAGLTITKKDIRERFSVDKTGQIYRVEVYREEKFSGMVLVNFDQHTKELIAYKGNNKTKLSVK